MSKNKSVLAKYGLRVIKYADLKKKKSCDDEETDLLIYLFSSQANSLLANKKTGAIESIKAALDYLYELYNLGKDA